MACLTPLYSANRSVREYVERFYLPAAAAYLRRAENGGALGAEISASLRAIQCGWTTLRFGSVDVDTRGDRHHFIAEVELGALAPPSVRVELYADPLGGDQPFRQEMTRLGRPDARGMDLYVASVPAARASTDYTARILPAHPGVSVPLEASQVLWQR
jgi:starch phosphorylase